MKHVLKLAAAGALAAGMIFAQSTPANTGQQPERGQRFRQFRANRAERMAKYLNLTQEQQDNAKKIMAEARQQVQPLRQQLKESREALMNAVKSGNDAQIDQITKEQAPLMAQMMAIRAKAFEKIYATLTPEQKTKADNMRQFFRSQRHEHAQSNG